MDVGDRFTHSDNKLYEIVGHYAMSYKTQLVNQETDKPGGQHFSMIPPKAAVADAPVAPIISITLRFRVIDQDQFKETLEHLAERGVEVSPSNTLAENVELAVTNLDVLALSPLGEGCPLGWNDVGLERISG